MQYTRFPPKRRDENAPAPPTPEGEAEAPAVEAVPAPRRTPRLQPAGVVVEAPDTDLAPVRLHRLVAVLMISIVVPIILNVAGLRLSPSRIVLLLAFLPAVFFWLAGRAGRVRVADVMVILCALWTIVALLAVEGLERLQYAGIVAIEMLCPYLIARVFIRGAADYAALVRFLRWIAIFLAPAALIEALTTRRPYVMILDPVFQVFGKADYEFRMGMSRAQVVFEHPILYGVYVATFCAPVYMLARAQGRSPVKALLFVAPVLIATFFSLSSGAFLGLFLQILLIGWGFVFRKMPGRWTLLAVLVAIAYVVVDLISNRTPFEVFISYLTFNSSTSYARVLIFTFGMDNVWAHPLFGLGLADWARPDWMQHDSVDNFWLLMAMRYGIPAFVFIALAFAAVFATMMRARPALRAAGMYRDAHVFSLIGLTIAMCTVHLWSATFVFAMFMLGAGIWVADAPRAEAKPGQRLPGVSPDPAAPSAAASPASRVSGQTRSRAPRRPAAQA